MWWELALVRKIVKSGKARYLSIASSFIPEDVFLVHIIITPLNHEWGKKVIHVTKKLGQSRINGSYKIIVPRNIAEYIGDVPVWVRITSIGTPSTHLFEKLKIPYLLNPRHVHYQDSLFFVSVAKNTIDQMANAISWSGKLYVAIKLNGEIVDVVKKPRYNKSLNRWYISIPSNTLKEIVPNLLKEIKATVLIIPVPNNFPEHELPEWSKILMEAKYVL